MHLQAYLYQLKDIYFRNDFGSDLKIDFTRGGGVIHKKAGPFFLA
jgi:hypothetical protein